MYICVFIYTHITYILYMKLTEWNIFNHGRLFLFCHIEHNWKADLGESLQHLFGSYTVGCLDNRTHIYNSSLTCFSS